MSARGQRRKPPTAQRLKPEVDPALAEQWQQDQLDPGNWLRIPEFGVRPADVKFQGFAFPILHPNAPMRDARLNVRDLVKAARTLVTAQCPTLADQRAAFLEWLEANDANPNARPTERQYAAAAYAIVMQQLEYALKQTEPEVRIEIPGERGLPEFFEDSLKALSTAAALLVDWSSGQRSSEKLAAARDGAGATLASKSVLKRRAVSAEKQAQVRNWCEQRLRSRRFLGLNQLARDAEKEFSSSAYSTIRGWCGRWKEEWEAAGLIPKKVSGER